MTRTGAASLSLALLPSGSQFRSCILIPIIILGIVVIITIAIVIIITIAIAITIIIVITTTMIAMMLIIRRSEGWSLEALTIFHHCTQFSQQVTTVVVIIIIMTIPIGLILLPEALKLCF